MIKQSVLVADDDSGFRDSLKDILEDHGYEILGAGSCAEAMDIAGKHMPPVALLDIKLPDGLGTELLEKLKELNKDCICVMMTAFADLETALQALEHGAFQYLQKPVHPQELLNLLKRIFTILQLQHEKIQAEKKLKESESILRCLLDAYPSGAMLIDLKGHIIAANRQVAGVNIKNTDELIGVDTSYLSSKPVYDNRKRKAFEAVSKRESIQFEENDNGRILYTIINPIINSENEVTSLAVFSRDITNAKMEAEEKRKLESSLVHAQRMEAIGTLAGGIAHDFNNLLQGILGYIELLQIDKESSDPEYSMLSEMKYSANRASELTKQLLTFSRKAGNEFKPLSLNRLIRQVEGLLRRTMPKMINMNFILDENLNAIEGDAGQIEQVIMNLALNARDAMPEGGSLTITTKNKKLDEENCKTLLECKPGKYVLLSVSDTGKGIDSRIVGHIFEPFFTTKELGKGTGLGLAMVFGIVKNHCGDIICKSNPDKGTSFNLYFPAADKDIEDITNVSEEEKLLSGSGTILVVEDEEILRNFTKQLLTRFGYNILLAESGEKALDLYNKHRNEISLVLLDLVMPGIGGRRCMEELLLLDPGIKILIASGYTREESMESLLKNGAKGFVAKPYDMKNLLNIVREVLDSA